nr:hypothetical protein [uncultured Butyrivibrio sp.]
MDEASWNPSPKYAPNKLKESGGANTGERQALLDHWKQEKVCPKQVKRVGWGIYRGIRL